MAEASLRECQSCQRKVPSLLKIDGGMRQRLRESTGATSVPPEVCNDCYTDLTSLISKGAQLKAQHHAKEQQRMMLWRSRVELLKQARLQAANKGFSEAAVLYEKYLRVLEIIYDVKSGELQPDFFNNRARQREIGVISMVYWDLVRIYDSSPRYGDRQAKAGVKLTQFLKVAPAIARKLMPQIQDFEKQSKNPAVIKLILKQAGIKKHRCFIATAAYQTEFAPEVLYLQAFRDQVLRESAAGRLFIETYYFLSPPIANWISRSELRRKPIRLFLKQLVALLGRRFNLKRQPKL